MYANNGATVKIVVDNTGTGEASGGSSENDLTSSFLKYGGIGIGVTTGVISVCLGVTTLYCRYKHQWSSRAREMAATAAVAAAVAKSLSTDMLADLSTDGGVECVEIGGNV